MIKIQFNILTLSTLLPYHKTIVVATKATTTATEKKFTSFFKNYY